MNSSIPWFQRIFFALLLAFLSILSVSGTIALRNVLHVVLLFMLLIYGVLHFSSERRHMVALVKAVPVPVHLWCGYLLVFPIFAPDREGAIANLLGKGMWGESMLAGVLALGVILILGTRRINLWLLALVSAVPVFIHLALLMLAWADVLQPSFYADPTLETAISSVSVILHSPNLVQKAFAAFPMGFRGIEPMHGNLGYPASQATCLGLAVAFSAWQRQQHSQFIKAVALIVACFLSVVIAQSRAATYFSLLLVCIAFLIHWWRFGGKRNAATPSDKPRSWKPIIAAIVLVAGSLLVLIQVFSTQLVWYSMGDKMAVGLRIENPRHLLCEGFSGGLSQEVSRMFPNADAEYLSTLIDGLNGDGARVLMARVGLELVREYPWGTNGGRDAYQVRMAQVCKHVPWMNQSHAHNAWINMALAIGCLGALAYGCVLFCFLWRGSVAIRTNSRWPAGMALMLLTVFWILRGGVDAVFQEHYLQMQAFFLIIVFFMCRNDEEISDFQLNK